MEIREVYKCIDPEKDLKEIQKKALEIFQEFGKKLTKLIQENYLKQVSGEKSI